MDVYSLVVAQHNDAGNYFANVLHYNVDAVGGTPPYDVAKAIADVWDTAIRTAWRDVLPDDCFIDYISCKRVNGLGGPSAVKAEDLSGTWATGESFSAGVAADMALISTDVSNRPGHIFIGAMPLDALVADVITTTFAAVLGTLATALIAPIAGGVITTANLAVYNRKLKLGYNVTHIVLREKVTMMNKRTLPLV